MRKVEINPYNGRRTLYIKGTPNCTALPKQDFDTFVANLELAIRDYYKDKDTETTFPCVRPPP